MASTEKDAEDDVTAIKVKLHPFIHQVGGSSLMFKLDSNTICKPFEPKEYQFYKLLPEELKSFTAEYKGSISIICEEDGDGTCMFYGVVPNRKITVLDTSTMKYVKKENDTSNGYTAAEVCLHANSSKYVDLLEKDVLKLKKSGSIEMDEDSLDRYDNPITKLETGSRLNKKLADLMDSNQRRFILLEDLVADFEHPSILDLKMGTRTYGDEESDGKKMRKARKAEKSTSKKLGVRLHGMQKYDQYTKKYLTIDKYEGLQLTEEQFKNSLKFFLNDGTSIRHDIVVTIIQRLQDFYTCISQHDTFRFYSSSLLIIYDGSKSNRQPLVNVKAIDFAHTTFKSSSPESCFDHVGPDKGYLAGIKTLLDIFSSYE